MPVQNSERQFLCIWKTVCESLCQSNCSTCHCRCWRVWREKNGSKCSYISRHPVSILVCVKGSKGRVKVKVERNKCQFAAVTVSHLVRKFFSLSPESIGVTCCEHRRSERASAFHEKKGEEEHPLPPYNTLVKVRVVKLVLAANRWPKVGTLVPKLICHRNTTQVATGSSEPSPLRSFVIGWEWRIKKKAPDSLCLVAWKRKERDTYTNRHHLKARKTNCKNEQNNFILKTTPSKRHFSPSLIFVTLPPSLLPVNARTWPFIY